MVVALPSWQLVSLPSARCCSCLNLHSVIDERIESSVSFCFFSCFTAALSAWDCACRFCFCLQLSASRLLFCSCLLRLKKSNGKARKDEDCKNHTLEPFPSWRPAGTWPVWCLVGQLAVRIWGHDPRLCHYKQWAVEAWNRIHGPCQWRLSVSDDAWNGLVQGFVHCVNWALGQAPPVLREGGHDVTVRRTDATLPESSPG